MSIELQGPAFPEEKIRELEGGDNTSNALKAIFGIPILAFLVGCTGVFLAGCDEAQPSSQEIASELIVAPPLWRHIDQCIAKKESMGKYFADVETANAWCELSCKVDWGGTEQECTEAIRGFRDIQKRYKEALKREIGK